MGIFGRLFGSGTSVDSIHKAFLRGDWAEVLRLADTLDPAVSAERAAELAEWTTVAGDRLAGLNLEEAEACVRAGDLERAREHLDLVHVHASRAELRQAADGLLADLEGGEADAPEQRPGCTDCAPGRPVATPVAQDDGVSDPDAEQAWELTLAALPPRWAESYGALSPELRQAVQAAHEGRDEEARAALQGLAETDRNEVVQYELAALLLRGGDLPAGLALLESLLRQVPDHDLALLLAIDLTTQELSLPWLETLLQQNLEGGVQVGLCRAGLARLALRAGQGDQLVEHTQGALDAGYVDPELLVRAAQQLEQAGRLDEAEAMLRRLPGGGCGGGIDPLLGEFWLRHARQPDQALNSFKHAARQDPENPRWALRIAQAYLLKGWKKETAAMVRQILRTPRLDQGLREEAENALRHATD